MIQLNFLNAVVEDNGNGLRVNGKDLNSIISAALGTIKKIPGRYEYLGEENKGKCLSSLEGISHAFLSGTYLLYLSDLILFK